MKQWTVQYPKKVAGETYWPKIGMAFQDPNGRIVVKLDALPLENRWDGRLVLYPVEDK